MVRSGNVQYARGDDGYGVSLFLGNELYNDDVFFTLSEALGLGSIMQICTGHYLCQMERKVAEEQPWRRGAFSVDVQFASILVNGALCKKNAMRHAMARKQRHRIMGYGKPLRKKLMERFYLSFLLERLGLHFPETVRPALLFWLCGPSLVWFGAT